MELSKMEKIVNEKIGPALEEIKDKLPKREDPKVNPYRIDGYIQNNSPDNKFKFIKIYFDESAFTKPINVDDFVNAFETYYGLVTDEKGHIVISEAKSEKQARVKIPIHGPVVAAHLDLKQGLMSYGYQLGNEMAQLMISVYIRQVLNNS
ncbi:hypothetical protein KY348_03835 [Candidatus Woesearchaeota archaeon]|nr:hypothetical protein [Candidatus Woesearchaeota archaeon]